MEKIKIGLLPLYLKMYDEVRPEIRKRLQNFIEIINCEFKKRQLDVLTSPVCMSKNQFENAISSFEDEQVVAIVTLHLAYSPSLESVDILSKTKIPIIILNTTETYSFNQKQNPEEIMYNHGIHGVQDLCNMLLKKGKSFIIETGHWKESNVLDRIVKRTKAAFLADNFFNSRVGSISGRFEGMGDINIPSKTLMKTLGIETIEASNKDITRLIPSLNDNRVKDEIKSDLKNYKTNKIKEKDLLNTTLIGIAIREWIKKNKLSAFTFNFKAIDKDSGFPTLPFLEASKEMAKGIGYAGEGDTLTAALVGALLSVYPDTSFTEMFCPDWKGDKIFLSHMGEVNIDLIEGNPELIIRKIPFTDLDDPAIAVGRLKPGNATLVNLSPVNNDNYRLIVSQVIIEEINGEDNMRHTVHGWFTPSIPISDYLTRFSEVGGIHHLAIVYGNYLDEIISFGKIINVEVIKI